MMLLLFLLQSAVDAGAISARAKPAAAAEKAKELQAILKQRGCVEEFEADPELLKEGQVRQLLARLMMMFVRSGTPPAELLLGRLHLFGICLLGVRLEASAHPSSSQLTPAHPSSYQLIA
jgi:hypothetical protein